MTRYVGGVNGQPTNPTARQKGVGQPILSQAGGVNNPASVEVGAAGKPPEELPLRLAETRLHAGCGCLGPSALVPADAVAVEEDQG